MAKQDSAPSSTYNDYAASVACNPKTHNCQNLYSAKPAKPVKPQKISKHKAKTGKATCPDSTLDPDNNNYELLSSLIPGFDQIHANGEIGNLYPCEMCELIITYPNCKDMDWTVIPELAAIYEDVIGNGHETYSCDESKTVVKYLKT